MPDAGRSAQYRGRSERDRNAHRFSKTPVAFDGNGLALGLFIRFNKVIRRLSDRAAITPPR
jgi:hypothetical protein